MLLLIIDDKPFKEDLYNLEKFVQGAIRDRKMKCQIHTLQVKSSQEKELFSAVSCYITNRQERTLLRCSYAYENNIQILSGVDNPVF